MKDTKEEEVHVLCYLKEFPGEDYVVHCVIGCGEVDKSRSIPIFNELREVQELTSAGLSWPETCLHREGVLNIYIHTYIHKRGNTIEFESFKEFVSLA